MKLILTLCILSVAVTCLEAAPQRLDWAELAPARRTEQRLKGFGDIWSNCTKEGGYGRIIDVTITPDPPVQAQNLSIKMEFSFSEEVTGGGVKLLLKWGIVTLVDQTLDLCATVQQLGLACPIAKGTHTLGFKLEDPAPSPSGNYTANIVFTDQNINELLCLDIDIQLT